MPTTLLCPPHYYAHQSTMPTTLLCPPHYYVHQSTMPTTLLCPRYCASTVAHHTVLSHWGTAVLPHCCCAGEFCNIMKASHWCYVSVSPRCDIKLWHLTGAPHCKGGGKLACAHGGSRMSISQPPPPLLARRDGAVTTGIHSPPVPPPYPQRCRCRGGGGRNMTFS